jgi:hypothetical protein
MTKAFGPRHAMTTKAEQHDVIAFIDETGWRA